MPPRLAIPKVNPSQRSSSTIRIPTFLLPFLHAHQLRRVSILSRLSDNPGAYSKRIRRGRGPSSGKGKTSGRGHKGQNQHGKVPAGFNGGQTPDHIVNPPRGRGFKNLLAPVMSIVNVDRIQQWIDEGRLDPKRPITLIDLHRSRCLHGIKDGIKLLAKDAEQLKTPIHITVSRASAAAIEAVESAGGVIQTRYYTKPSIRRILQGQTHPTLSLLSRQMSTATDKLLQSTVGRKNPHTVIHEARAMVPDVPALVPPENTLLPPSAFEFGRLPFEYRYRLPDPAKRKDLEYYRDPAHRGYLSYQLAPGQGPSLFYKTPVEKEADLKKKEARKLEKKGAKNPKENLIW